MYVVNDDLSIYCTRGDYCHIPVQHQFKTGDVVRFKAFRKKDCATVVIQRDFTVEAEADSFVIPLTGEDTKIGEVISKPVDYWYEVELNPDTSPQTIIGYDDEGAKVFKLFPEGKDVDAEDIEVVGKKTLQELVDYALLQAKESGEFNGADGEDGYTPVKGVDYYTESEKAALVDEVTKTGGGISPTPDYYFSIDYDGVVSLKAEYQADGSNNAELPEIIVIPDVIDGTAVSGLQARMFQKNLRVKEITIPDGVTEIPERFCSGAKNLTAIHNTAQVTKLGMRVVLNTQIKKAIFPNLKEVAPDGALAQATSLYFVDIGDNITEIPYGMFRACTRLSLVKGGGSVKTIGKEAFYLTHNLKNLPFLSQVTAIGARAFFRSRIQFDWSTIKGQCNFGEENDYATPVIDNTTDYWTGVKYTPCENRIVTTMSQSDSRWKNNYFGEYTSDYYHSCAVFAILHIHSALSGKLYSHPDEFAEDVRVIDASLLTKDKNPTNFTNVAPFFTKLGYKTTVREADITQEIYQEICYALARGAYVYSQVSADNSADNGHAVAIYGINSNKEVLVLDSGTHGVLTYRIPYQNLTGPSSNIVIVEKKID